MNKEFDARTVSEAIIKWLKSRLEISGQECFVVGVSGGIDSAVVASLCARTERIVMSVILPCNSSEGSINRARGFAAELYKKYSNSCCDLVNIDDILSNLKSFIADRTSVGKMGDLTKANLISRLRMVVLYLYANQGNGIVVGTGNKIEDFGVGFFTKYGDGGVDISPIGDLYKSEVYALGEYLGVPKEIREAEPSDGLWGDDRTDEEQLGASYDELEWAMKEYESGNAYVYNCDASFYNQREMQVLNLYSEKHKQNLHKMQPIPIFKMER